MARKSLGGVLAGILAPVTTQEFAGDYFGKRPLFVRGTPHKFDGLMTPANFIHGLDRVPEIRCVFGELRQATIGPADIKEMFEAGATICVTGIERAHRRLQDAARRIEREIGFLGRVDFRAYLSPPDTGFDFHYDARIATSLQIDGSKTWWYSTEAEVAYPTENSPRSDMTAVRRSVSRHDIKKVTLRPGDLLCLPAGVWHKAEAGSGGSLALNMAFNHTGATVLDVVLQRLREKLVDRADGRQPFLLGVHNNRAGELERHWDGCLRDTQDALNALGAGTSVFQVGRHLFKRARARPATSTHSASSRFLPLRSSTRSTAHEQ